MITLNGETGLVEINSKPNTLINEIIMFIKAINQQLDKTPEILRNSIIETIVDDDETYAEICKFAIRMNKGKERCKEIKEKFPDLFDENGNPNYEKTYEAFKETISEINDLLDGIKDI